MVRVRVTSLAGVVQGYLIRGVVQADLIMGVVQADLIMGGHNLILSGALIRVFTV